MRGSANNINSDGRVGFGAISDVGGDHGPISSGDEGHDYLDPHYGAGNRYSSRSAIASGFMSAPEGGNPQFVFLFVLLFFFMF